MPLVLFVYCIFVNCIVCSLLEQRIPCTLLCQTACHLCLSISILCSLQPKVINYAYVFFNIILFKIDCTLCFALVFSVVWGECNHTFHNCCMSLWVKQNNRCPLCQQEWHIQRTGKQSSLLLCSLQKRKAGHVVVVVAASQQCCCSFEVCASLILTAYAYPSYMYMYLTFRIHL